MKEEKIYPFQDMKQHYENTFHLCEFPSGEIVLMNGYDMPVGYEELQVVASQISKCAKSATPEKIKLYTDFVINEERKSKEVLNRSEKIKTKPKRKLKRGFIYIIRLEGDIYKIGRTDNLQSRISTYRTHAIKDVDLVHYVEVADMVTMEEELLKHFSSQRIDERERFLLSADDLAFIKNFPEYLAEQGVDVRL